MIVEVIVFCLFLYLLVYYFNKTKDNLPPGPWSVPCLGRLPLETVQQCLEMQKKYGKLVMIRVGAYNLLYIMDYKLSKEAYFKSEFSDRPAFKFLQMLPEERDNQKPFGILSSSGTHWIHNRRFLLRHLRDLGMGKSRMEGVIMREVEDLVEDFKALTDKPTKLSYSLNIAALNIVWQLVASHRYEFSDDKVQEFMKTLDDVQKYTMRMALPEFFPILNYVLPSFLLDYLTGKSLFEKWGLEFVEIVQPFIDDHLAKLDPNNPVDLMDDYLIEMKAKKSENYSHFNLADLTKITFDLFIAGNDTTANMVRWVLLYMTKFPFVQKKIQEEIDSIVERDSFPGLEHRERLAYLDATINEVQRQCSMVSFGLMKGLTSEVVLDGYRIPKNTVAFSLAGVSHCDPTYFKNPEEFDPARFLDTNGKFIPTCDGFQAFGIGKRQCIGEQFARMELYLVVAALLQTFSFSAPQNEEIDLSPADCPTFNIPKKDKIFILKLRK